MAVALCLGGRPAHAQTAPVSYWIPGWPLGFGGNLADGQRMNSYGNFPSFDARDARGFSYTRTNFSNGWFAGSERGSMGLNGISSDPAFGSFRYQGTQFGYNFQNAPLTLYGGIGTMKYDSGIAGALSPLNSLPQFSGMSGTSVHAGVEYRPTSNLSLSVGVGYTQTGRADSDTPSPALSSESPYSLVGHR